MTGETAQVEAMLKINMKHVERVQIETGTRIWFEVHLLEKARIPSLTVHSKDSTPDGEVEGAKVVTVEQMSGVSTQVAIPEPHTVASLKKVLEGRLQIPLFLQTVVNGAEELRNSDVISAQSVTLLQREPARISTDAFLESMVYCREKWEDASILRRFHGFDTSTKFPTGKKALLEWTWNFRNMKHTPFSADSFVDCVDCWLQLNEGRKGKHPEAFISEIAELTFLESQCFSPSLLPYSEPYVHEFDVEWVFFIVGRLRAPQTLAVSFLFNLWI